MMLGAVTSAEFVGLVFERATDEAPAMQLVQRQGRRLVALTLGLQELGL